MNRLQNSGPFTYLITTGHLTAANFRAELNNSLDKLSQAAECGVTMIQIREKRLPAKMLFELVERAVERISGSNVRILVNERTDIALGAGAGGVHLTTTSIPIDAIRRSFPDELLIGASTHSRSEALEARDAGADFVVYGPVFHTPSKERYGEPCGIKELAKVCSLMSGFPVIALGGIDETNYRSALAAGVSGLAAIRFFEDTRNLRKVVKDLARENAKKQEGI